jgi:hypothetical protein
MQRRDDGPRLRGGDGFGRVAVGVPYWKGCGPFFQWWSLLLVGGFEDDDELLIRPDVPVEVPIPMAHNAIVRAFLTTEADTLCMIEDDHVADQEVVRRMRTKPANLEFDIVCASYVNRRGTPLPMGWFFGDGQGRILEPGEPLPANRRGYQCCFDLAGVTLSGTQAYDGAAAGLVLIRRWVLEEILAQDDASLEHCLWFEWKGESSQDVDFYAKARAVGARVGVDRDNWVGHVGTKVWTRDDFVQWRDGSKGGGGPEAAS